MPTFKIKYRISYIYSKTGLWIYPLLGDFTPMLRVLFMIDQMLITIVINRLGQITNGFFHQYEVQPLIKLNFFIFKKI